MTLVPIPGVPSWIGDLGHLDGLDEAALATDATGQVIFANLAARRLYRYLGEDFTKVGLARSLLPEGEHEQFTEIERQVAGGQHWTGRLDVRRADGSVRAADVSCSPLRRDGEIMGLVCVVDDAVGNLGQEREARRLEDRLTRLARVAAELGTAEDVPTVTKIVVSQAADAVGATVASLSLAVDDDTLALVGLRGGPEGARERWATYSRHEPHAGRRRGQDRSAAGAHRARRRSRPGIRTWSWPATASGRSSGCRCACSGTPSG